MNDLIKFMLPLAAVGLFACGGGSGVDGTKTIGSLTPAEAASFCDYQAGKAPTADVDCPGDEPDIKAPTAAEATAARAACITGFTTGTSSCTVGQAEACIDSGTGDFCADQKTATVECATYISCLFGT